MMTQGPAAVSEPIVVNLSPPEIKVAAGAEPVELNAVVRNASPTVDQYRIEIENLDPSWYTVTVDSVALFPGDSASIPIKLHPPKNSNTRAGHYTFIVRARSNADPSLVGVTKGVVQIGSYSIFQAELAPKRASGRKGNFRLNLSNGGNSEVQLDLSGRDAENKLRFGFRPSRPTVVPNTKKSIPVVVKPKGIHLVGQEERYQFIITAQPTDGTEKDAREAQGELAHKPMFATWKWPLAFLALLLLLFVWAAFKPDVNPCSAQFLIPSGARFYTGFACQAGVLKPFAPATGTSKEGSCQSGPGFTEVRKNYNNLIGDCVESEWADALGNAHQRTQNGELMYFTAQAKGAEIYFFGSNNKIFTFTNCAKGTFNNCTQTDVGSPPAASPQPTP